MPHLLNSPTPRQQKTRQLFLEAVVRLVIRHGLDNINVTQIADEANYGRWTFYQYFEGKEDAAWQAFTIWMNALDVQLIAVVQHLPWPRREYQSWRLIFHAVDVQRSFFARLGEIAPWRYRAKAFLIEQFLGHLRAGRFALMPNVQHEVAARLYVAAITDLIEHWLQYPELGTPDSLAAQLFTFIFNQPPPTDI
jgi:AcrR family transcriptional regulator